MTESFFPKINAVFTQKHRDDLLESLSDSPQTDQEQLVNGFGRFIATLYDVPRVDSFGFRAFRQPPVPVTTVELCVVLRDVDDNDESDDTLERVLDADGVLAERTYALMPSVLSFIDTGPNETDNIKANLFADWKAEGVDTLASGFVQFDRQLKE